MGRKDIKTTWVHCYRDGTLLRSYDFGAPLPVDASAFQWPSRESLEAEVKTNLTTERLAFPPYEGIRFEIEYE